MKKTAHYVLVLRLGLFLCFCVGLACVSCPADTNPISAIPEPTLAPPPVAVVVPVTIPQAPSEKILSIEEMQIRRKDAETLAATDETAKKTVERWDRGISALREALRVSQQTETLRSYIASATATMQKSREELQRLNSTPIALPPGAQTNDIETLRVEVKLANEAMAEAEQSLKTANDALSSPLYNPAQLKERYAESRKQRELIEAEMKINAELAPAQQPAQRQSQLAVRYLHSSEMDYFDLLSSEHDTLNRMQTLQRDVAVAKTERARKLRSAWNALLAEQLTKEVRESRAVAVQQQREVAGGPIVLRELAERNLALNDELKQLYALDTEASSRLELAELSLKTMQSDAESMEQRFTIVGPTESIGLLLLRRRAELPARPKYRIAFSRRQSLISTAANRQLDIDADRERLANLNGAVNKVMEELPYGTPGMPELREQVAALLTVRSQTLADLYSVMGSYITKLTVIQLTENKLIAQSEAFRNQLDEWLMITPTIPHLSLSEFFTAIPKAVKNLIANVHSDKHRLFSDVLQVARDAPGSTLSAALAAFIALLFRPAMRRRLQTIHSRIGRIKTDSFTYTLETFFYTAVFALPFPLLIRTAALALRSTVTDTSILIQACADGLIDTSAVIVLFSLLHQTIRPNGLAELHFGWPRPTLKAFGRTLWGYSIAATILVFIISFNSKSTVGMDAEGDGRVAFILLMLLTTMFAFRLIHTGSVIRLEIQRHCITNSARQWNFVWIPLATGLPLVLATFSALGYEFAAKQLAERTFYSVFFMFSLFLVRDMLIRWLTLVERRLRYRDAVRRLEESRAERNRNDERPDDREDFSIDIPDINFGQLGDKAKRLIRTGMVFSAIIGVWSIWIDALPLFNFLDNARLPTALTPFLSESVLTLGDIAGLGLTIFLTVVIVSNLPGMLELLLLQSRRIDAGARYAITKLSQYGIVMAGTIISAHVLGFRWENIQWLIAALSVGIGFGLQEVVANFICGILILSERPIRVGDIITIGETSGIVSRVQMRATTVVNWERQELLIPNKEFITGRVLNWTLSDTVNRIMINVGIAYGSDVSRAIAILSQICEDNPNILREPKWMIHFETFGDSSLNLSLRAYIPSIDNRLATITQVNTAIHELFLKNGIVIPFPQRDIHMIPPEIQTKKI